MEVAKVEMQAEVDTDNMAFMAIAAVVAVILSSLHADKVVAMVVRLDKKFLLKL